VRKRHSSHKCSPPSIMHQWVNDCFISFHSAANLDDCTLNFEKSISVYLRCTDSTRKTIHKRKMCFNNSVTYMWKSFWRTSKIFLFNYIKTQAVATMILFTSATSMFLCNQSLKNTTSDYMKRRLRMCLNT